MSGKGSRMQFEDARIGDKVVMNTAFNIIGRLWFFIVGFFLTPYIVGRLGVERYAVWALVGVITNYFGLLDFGVGSSFVKYVSEFHTIKEYSGINKLVNTGFAFYVMLGAGIVALAALFAGPLMSFLKIPVPLHEEARFVFVLAVGIFCVSNAMGVFMAIQAGLQRMDLANKVAVAASLATVAGTVFFLEQGYGLRGLIVNNAIVLVLTSVMYIVSAYRLLPELSFRPFSWDQPMFKRIFSFGWRIQFSRIAGTVTVQTDKVLIAYFLSVGLVTFYQLGSNIVMYAITVPGLLVSALVPAFSEIEARGERRRLIESYLRSTKYLAFAAMPLFVFIAVAAHRIMFVWMGVGYAQSAGIIRILAAAFLVNVLARASGALCMAIERPGYLMSASLIMIALNIPLSILLIDMFGFFGAAWGTMLSVNAGTSYFLYRLHKNLAVPAGSYLRATAPFLIASLAAAAFAYSFDSIARAAWPDLKRIGQAAVLSAACGMFAFVYLAILYRARLFDANDIGLVKDKFPSLYRFLKKIAGGYGT